MTLLPDDTENLTWPLGLPELAPQVRPTLKVVEANGGRVGEPPAWSLNCTIGSGTFGTVFLEKVLTRGMDSPKLWAVKRIPRALPNFTFKRYQAEINNLQALAKVSLPKLASFHHTHPARTLVWTWVIGESGIREAYANA